MSIIIVYSVVLLLFCGVPTFSQEERALHYELQEEVFVGTFVGNILVDSGLSRKYYPDVIETLHFSFLSEPRIRLSIGSTDGIIRTSGRIDRDKICPGKETCTVDLDIAVRPVQYFQIIKATVEILDLNDNWPKFPESKITHPILESATIGSSFVIPSAVDDDSPQYGIQRYQLTESSSNKFELKVTTKLDGSNDVRLVLRGELDREVEQLYTMQVIASDDGARPGKLSITINVLDSNDNDPVFDHSKYNITIPENVPIRNVILRVHATDHDAGANGRVVYGFSSQTLATYGSLFGLNNKTGEIYIKDRIDYEQADIYHLMVTAADQGPDSLPADATVVIHVLDLNDNPPQITVNTLAASGTNRAEIAEDSPTGTFVAHVTVTDPDSGRNGKFNCSLNDNTFSLHQRYVTEYQIITAAELDRERVPQYNLALVCRDSGAEPQVAIKHIQVIVTDTNDHSPVFKEQKYTAALIENNYVGARVVSVNATDRDAGSNADIKYQLSRAANKWFQIGSKSGIITAKESIDRERNEQFSFYALAIDKGKPAKTGTALVTVTVEDVNDESPRFSSPGGYTFKVEENKLPGEEVGTVSATDKDGPMFNKFQFSFVSPASEAADTFFIHPQTGIITTKVKLDREIQTVYHMSVIASDASIPPISSSVSVTVSVTDINDNKPEFEYPNDRNNTVHISNKVPIKYIVTKVTALDSDLDINSKISYIFFSGNEEKIFEINEETGIITVKSDLKDINDHMYGLHIMAKDNGIPERFDVALLNIVVNKSIPYPIGGSSQHSMLSGHNFVIVISIACACAVITIILVIAIILIRRKDRGKRIHKYNCRMEALRMLTAKETLSPSEESTPCKEPSKGGGNGEILRNGRPVHVELIPASRQRQRHCSGGHSPVKGQAHNHGRPWVMPQKEGEVHNLLHMWPGRHDDGESVHSGDGSNTDSGRGASEEGENAHKLDAHQAGVQGRTPRPDPQPSRGQAGGHDPAHPGYYVAPQRPHSSHSYSSHPPTLHSFSRDRGGPSSAQASRPKDTFTDNPDLEDYESSDSVVHARPARVVPARTPSHSRTLGPANRHPLSHHGGQGGILRSSSQIPRIPSTIQRTNYTVPPGTSIVGTTSAPPYKSEAV